MEPQTLWIIAGIVLLISEMLTGGFFLIFISLGSFAGGLVASTGQTPVAQGLTCAAVSVLGVWFLRAPIQRRVLKKSHLTADVGREIQTDQAIPAGQQARITYQGTLWQATNLDHAAIQMGDRVVIVGIDGNALLIRKAN